MHDYKQYDVKNRRQEPVRIESMYDLSCCRYFNIGSDSRKFLLKGGMYNEWSVYLLSDEQGQECIGYMKPVNKRCVEITVRKHGLLFSARIKLSACKGYGNKLPIQS